MLHRRLLSAFVIISVMIFLLWLDCFLGKPSVWGRPGLILGALAVFLSVMAADELTSMWREVEPTLESRPLCFFAFLMALGCVVPLFSALQTNCPNCPIGNFGWAVIGLVAAIGLAFLWEMRVATLDHASAKRLALCVLGLGYLFILLAFLSPHRLLQQDNVLGVFSIVALITTVKLSDGAAYFVGRAIGTIKLAPVLSPGKTLQGALGGIVGGVAGAFLMFYVVAPHLFGISIDKTVGWVIAYGVLLTVAGMFGDLAESFLKRTAGCKDSSSWFPGLGGILDVIDSLIAAAPVSFLMWML